MPQFDETTREKINDLRVMRILGEPIEGPYELVKVEWPAPDGTIYYGTTDVANVASVPPPVDVDLRLIPEDLEKSFLPVEIDASIGDEEVELTFWDADDLISDLVNDHGEGIRTTLLYWFPQVELLLPVWEGHLRRDDEGEIDILKLKATQGFRSSDANIPSRAHYAYCQAVFGGQLETQELIDEYGCPFNAHVPGGTIGTIDPSTGLPWTYCPRRDPANCTERGVNPLFHLSHRTQVATIINSPAPGSRLLSGAIGNETNLTEPVRVVMGPRRAHDMKLLAYRRDINTNNPEHGWFQGFYEGPEGPQAYINNARITVGGVTQNAVPIHYGARLGNFGDASPDNSITTHGYSATSFIRYAFGWTDPATIDPEDASASAMFSGLRDIRVYRNAVTGQRGLLVIFYSDTTFSSEYGRTVTTTINYPLNTFPPADGMPMTNWSMKIVGKIMPRYSEAYTFKSTHDDGMKLIIDGVTIIDQLSATGTHTGTTAVLAADTLYDFELWFKQSVSVWYLDLKWSSASQIEEIVPFERIFVDNDDEALYTKQVTNNRVWHIARALTDKRWGNGRDYESFYIPSWIDAAEWSADVVRFTDVNGTHWDHTRGLSAVELIERKVQTQIEDLCMAGRLSRPFLFDGLTHIMPLRALTDDELAECPEFTDEGENKNIIWEGDEGEEKTTLKRSQVSDLDLPNRIECTADLATEDYKKTPLQPVEDIDAQLRAGRVLGNYQRKINSKKYHLLGVVDEAQTMKLQWSLLDLGPFDEGGLQNNLRLTFKIWFMDALDLHQEKVIKVTSSKITKYGFTHFRIKKLKRLDNLHYEVTAQAYNHAYMTAFETLLSDLPVPPTPPGPPEPPTPEPPQCKLEFGDVSHDGFVLRVPIEPCLGVTAILDGGAPDTDFANITDAGNSAQTFSTGYDGATA